MFTKKSHYLELVIAVLLCCTLSNGIEVLKPGPDAQLYHGLSINLFSETGYIDNIRNDYILPSIGHPLLLGVFEKIGFDNGEDITRYLHFISLVLSYLFGFLLLLKSYIRFLIIFFLNSLIPAAAAWGIEMSLVFTIILLWIAIYSFFKTKTTKTALFLGLALVFNLLVRPILAPIFYFALATTLLAYLINRKRFKEEALAFGICAIIFFGIKGYSILSHNDSRMVTGTYSEITLYSGNNKYIPLERKYSSTLWKTIPDSLYNEATSPFKLKTTWQDRAALLREKVVHFMSNNSDLALKGFRWRLEKFTIDQDSKYGTNLLYFWLALIPFFIWRFKHRSLFKLIVLSLPIYVVLVTSVFPYVGPRYLLSPNLYFLCSVLIMISYLDTKNIITSKSMNNRGKS